MPACFFTDKASGAERLHLMLSIYHFTKENSSQGADGRGQDGRPYNGCGIGAAELAAVSEDVDGNQLQGGNVED